MISRSEKNKDVVKEINREKTIKTSKTLLIITLIIALFFIFLYLYTRFIGTSFINSNEFIVHNSNIPASFHGIKIVHLSDILYGSTIDKKDLAFLKKEISLIKPDIIVFTGDLITSKYNIQEKEIKDLTNFLNELDACLGKYAVKGELDNSTFDLIMNDTNFTVLNNDFKLVYNKDNTPIVISGLNINDLNKINNTNNYYQITLIHNYDYYTGYSTNANLVLAGHNLGGEIKLPLIDGFIGNNKYQGSHYNKDNHEIYISNGLGSIHKMRLFNHPSINVYRLYNN